MKDMRSMPSSSSSPPSPPEGGGGGFFPPPPGRRERRATSVTAVVDEAAGETGSWVNEDAVSEVAVEDAPPPSETSVPFCSSDGFIRYALCSVVEADALCPFETAS